VKTVREVCKIDREGIHATIKEDRCGQHRINIYLYQYSPLQCNYQRSNFGCGVWVKRKERYQRCRSLHAWQPVGSIILKDEPILVRPCDRIVYFILRRRPAAIDRCGGGSARDYEHRGYEYKEFHGCKDTILNPHNCSFIRQQIAYLNIVLLPRGLKS
jgi:hypothetical protein